MAGGQNRTEVLHRFRNCVEKFHPSMPFWERNHNSASCHYETVNGIGKANIMHSIVYLIGLVVIVLAILNFIA